MLNILLNAYVQVIFGYQQFCLELFAGIKVKYKNVDLII